MPRLPTPFSAAAASAITGATYTQLAGLIPRGSKTAAVPQLEERKARIETTAALLKAETDRYNVRLYAQLGCAAVALKVIPPKLNPLIKSLMDSIKVSCPTSLQLGD